METLKRIGLSAIPEVIDTFASLFEDLSIPPEAVAYALFELKKLDPDRFKSPKCPEPISSQLIPRELLLDLYDNLIFSVASYGPTSYLYAECDVERSSDDGVITESASVITKWAKGSFSEHVALLVDAHTTGTSDDILVMSFPDKQEAFRCAYFILDHKVKEEIVISLRGTYYVCDAITDLVASASDFMGGQCHKGMLRTAENIVDEIRDELRRVVAVRGADYPVTITGHSLGGSVGSILAMMLKDEFNVRCFAFACPSVFSADLVDRSKEIVTSLATSTDIVPRLSYQSFQLLAEDVTSLLDRSPTLADGGLQLRLEKMIHSHLKRKTIRMQERALGDTCECETDEESDASDGEEVEVTTRHQRSWIVRLFLALPFCGCCGRLQAKLHVEKEHVTHESLHLAPLLPAGRAIRISGLAKADAEALRRGVEAYREAGHPSPQAPGVDEPFPVREILQNPLTETMGRLAGLGKEYLFAHDVDNESFGRIIVHKACVLHHYPIVYIRAIEKCIAVQDEIGDYLAASEE
ncbi:Lipase (class 3) [Carpediemonas membranifera]|uniref:sn-1-specific diacylglycerol lipase n=1 Tax=Carpediemonas membranifera TaxID=201153 RepID=A0A8J6AVX5_9EUKA|nr:Lipase (class 3) [Carpediemonas membranifera]|eukprot:KAG9396136.1 Lipase (class 3) [Carpediemonas membranifera]